MLKIHLVFELKHINSINEIQNRIVRYEIDSRSKPRWKDGLNNYHKLKNTSFIQSYHLKIIL